ncbi:uncharacterized protein LOC126354400 [Schistocerca gregaria]|uniref:uncharacterized protein LOC126354339 n=1 Tax=Schistocerca gregaria TaxID=7010 RepID=UPI00211E0464|nr:uncharacterized protein LOC126354339 [Schistocerca gregaria]XP_049859967.1 uncharacterized protein LOC126354400 [Schistocerca gregaria]
MFWILRRTRLAGAAAFFNAINNNSSSSGGGASGSGSSGLSNSNNNHPGNGAKQGYDRLPADEGHLTAASSDSGSDVSEDSDYDELACNVCDRTFCNARQLAHHQEKKRHFACSSCDSLFPSLEALHHHRQQFQHWTNHSPMEPSCSSSSSADETSDDTVSSEELERLL